jgi:hypothetical protein
MAKLEVNEKAHQENVKIPEYPLNTRIRLENVSLLDVLIEEQQRMNKTEEGKQLFEYIANL